MSELIDQTEPVARLKDLFTAASVAVMAAQRRLDAQLNLDYLARCETRGQTRLYSIPRATVAFAFGLDIEAKQKVLLILRSKQRHEQHTHQLNFSLIAVPERPPDINTPATGVPLSLIEPPFLVTPQDEMSLYVRLLAALADPNRRAFALVKPPPAPEKLLPQEIERIIKAFAEPQSERGLVFFRSNAPDEYLIVRVTRKSENDSIFVLRPGAQTEVIIYSLEGDDTNEVHYEPLHNFALSVRAWLEGAPSARVELKEGLPPNLGLESLQIFAANMRAGYTAALKLLAAQPADDAGGQPTYYDLTDVLAELSYSVEYEDAQTPRFNFARRRTVDNQSPGGAGEQNYKLIESRALIRARRERDSARLEVELAAPEFVLAGAARVAFFHHLDENEQASLNSIASAFGKDDDGKVDAALVRRYAAHLANELQRHAAVIYLSYKGQTPKEEFLVIWPGGPEPPPRDFVFTCKVDNGQLKLINIIMRLGDVLGNMTVKTPGGQVDEPDLSQAQYQAFHNFFHAVRIWRARINPARGGAN
jgi:hypothetical protein